MSVDSALIKETLVGPAPKVNFVLVSKSTKCNEVNVDFSLHELMSFVDCACVESIIVLRHSSPYYKPYIPLLTMRREQHITNNPRR